MKTNKNGKMLRPEIINLCSKTPEIALCPFLKISKWIHGRFTAIMSPVKKVFVHKFPQISTNLID